MVRALRFYSLAYIHGHQVGGTNPSLVEALGADNPVLARDNTFNRWVAGPTARYFSGSEDLARQLQDICTKPQVLTEMRIGSRVRFEEAPYVARCLGALRGLAGAFSSRKSGIKLFLVSGFRFATAPVV